MIQLGTMEAMQSLRSALCPSCGGVKKPKQSLCFKCYKKLSPAQRDDLYQPMMDGYEEAISAALTALGVTTPTLKAEVPR